MSFWPQLLRHIAGGEPAFLALVAANTRHSPGTAGARMFVRPGGETYGTVGGGVMEGTIIDMAENALSQGHFEPRCQTLYHRKSAPGETSGMICAGTQTNVYYLCDQNDLDALEEVVRRQEADRAGLLILSGEGLRVEDGEPNRSEAPFRLEEGESWCYREQLLNWKRAAIIGGGHCGLALSRVLGNLGYTVTVFETRPDVFTFRQNDFAEHRIVVDDFAEAAAKIRYPELTHVIVMTADQPSDVRGLYGVYRLNADFPYVGAMGSAAKLHKIRKDLEDFDVSPESFVDLYAPIGLNMTSNTPEEIAISVAGELLREREKLFPFARPDR